MKLPHEIVIDKALIRFLIKAAIRYRNFICDGVNVTETTQYEISIL